MPDAPEPTGIGKPTTVLVAVSGLRATRSGRSANGAVVRRDIDLAAVRADRYDTGAEADHRDRGDHRVGRGIDHQHGVVAGVRDVGVRSKNRNALESLGYHCQNGISMTP
jgi:hypothetical protein